MLSNCSIQSCAASIASSQRKRQPPKTYAEKENHGSYRDALSRPRGVKPYRVLDKPSDVSVIRAALPEKDLTFMGWNGYAPDSAGTPARVLRTDDPKFWKGKLSEWELTENPERNGWFHDEEKVRDAIARIAHLEQERFYARIEKEKLDRERDGKPRKKMPRPPRPEELAFDLRAKRNPATEKNWRHVPLPHFHDESGEDGEINLPDVAGECASGDENERVRPELLARLAEQALMAVTDQRKANALRRKLVSVDKLKIFSPYFQ